MPRRNLRDSAVRDSSLFPIIPQPHPSFHQRRSLHPKPNGLFNRDHGHLGRHFPAYHPVTTHPSRSIQPTHRRIPHHHRPKIQPMDDPTSRVPGILTHKPRTKHPAKKSRYLHFNPFVLPRQFDETVQTRPLPEPPTRNTRPVHPPCSISRRRNPPHFPYLRPIRQKDRPFSAQHRDFHIPINPPESIPRLRDSISRGRPQLRGSGVPVARMHLLY